uniref:LOW QUALITY PROTEIN: MIF4G domain-containing protein B-like n=1 Tax=Styela clava TaxID=7725 RepID=UPI001939D6D8|nr:LOW QUALITY PROTEIN: MIF4G domain-containing protein B-like [Styela clava]
MEHNMLEQLGFNRKNRDAVSKALGGWNTSGNNQQDIRPLVEIIVLQAISDVKYGSNAAKLCSIFVENEGKISNDTRFRNILLTKLQREYTNIRTTEEHNEARLIAFVTFLSSIFHHIRIDGRALVALVTPVFGVFGFLASVAKQSNKREEIIQCLVMQIQLHGEELEGLNEKKMAELFCIIRELFLSETTSQLSRLLLLEIIELRAGNWKLSSDANTYYYDTNSV